ncbi:MAG: hypothetical protein XD98_0583 [Microgenomates bacterium 39_6]|nr:MAG: hypothetical protein XD98_0583 [Microgenomates bacterium 39_6]
MGLETEALIQIIAKPENSSWPSEANWTFYRPEHAREDLSTLYHIFDQIRSELNRPKASFLDCGCGNGVAALTASRAGFEAVYGIEKNKTLLKQAKENLAAYTSQNGNLGLINFFPGSCYELLPSKLKTIDLARQQLANLYEQEGIFDSPSFKDYVQALLNSQENSLSISGLLKNYLFPNQNSQFFKKAGIIKRGQLAIDVVYIYPSDIFFDRVFLPQIGQVMKEGSLLAVLTPEDDPIKTGTSLLQEKEAFSFPSPTRAPLVLQVFQKKP